MGFLGENSVRGIVGEGDIPEEETQVVGGVYNMSHGGLKLTGCMVVCG